MSIVNLLNNIDVDNSFFKQKKDTVLLMLKKAKEGGKWDAVTKMDKIAADKRVPKVDEKADPQASLMSMMKHMYDDGDDEMKRSIKKAWHESQSKKGPGMGMEGFGNLDDL
uniref:SGS domain-containing protein n=1 Tax=Plectus sambesii TaxID=2011161 RepID=A0A914WCP1_9BILA